MSTFFTVRPSDLDQLSLNEAVDIFRELLWAEITALGIPKNEINVPTVINAPDGGIVEVLMQRC
jgi:hypothetical protein